MKILPARRSCARPGPALPLLPFPAWLSDFLATKLPRRSWVLLRRVRFRSPPGRALRRPNDEREVI